MEETAEVIKYEISDNFNDMNFGCLKKASGYSAATDLQKIAENDKSSSIPIFICSVIKYGLTIFFKRETSFFNHYTGLERYERLAYIRAEIKFSSLKKGEDLTEKSLKFFRPFQLPGDDVSQFIPKSLGGYDGPDNAFNLHSTADKNEWQNALKKCHDHLSADGEEGKSIRYIYVLAYKLGTFRPSNIIYHFILYSNNGEKVDEIIEGKINNQVHRKS